MVEWFKKEIGEPLLFRAWSRDLQRFKTMKALRGIKSSKTEKIVLDPSEKTEKKSDSETVRLEMNNSPSHRKNCQPILKKR